MSSEKPGETMGDSFAAMFEAEKGNVPARRKKDPRVGDRLEAVVVQIGKDLVFVELDTKQSAFIEADELRDDQGEITVKVGEKIRAHVVEVDEQAGTVRLGRSAGRAGSVASIELPSRAASRSRARSPASTRAASRSTSVAGTVLSARARRPRAASSRT